MNNANHSGINYFNILKGIGILSIVIGHCCNFAGKYVYSYHLALFFFISGFLYNEKKYGKDPFLNLANRLKNNYPRYVLYAAMIGILHDFLVDIHIYDISRGKQSFYDFRNYILNSMVMINTEPLYGATWFVAPLICSSAIFGGIIYISNILKEKWNSNLIKNLSIIILGLICCLLGYERMVIKYTLLMRLDVSLFVIPLFIIAYYLNLYIKNYYQYLKGYIALIFFGLSIFLCYKIGWNIDLVSQQVEIYHFYVLAIIGIYECMYLAKLIKDKQKILAKVFSFLGEYSFEIMSFHFLCFKIIDVLYSRIVGITDFNIIQRFPYSYDFLWLIYIVGGGYFACTMYSYYQKQTLEKVFP